MHTREVNPAMNRSNCSQSRFGGQTSHILSIFARKRNCSLGKYTDVSRRSPWYPVPYIVRSEEKKFELKKKTRI